MGCVEEGDSAAVAYRLERPETQAKAEPSWPGRHRRRFEETVGGKEGGGETGTSRRQKNAAAKRDITA